MPLMKFGIFSIIQGARNDNARMNKSLNREILYFKIQYLRVNLCIFRYRNRIITIGKLRPCHIIFSHQNNDQRCIIKLPWLLARLIVILSRDFQMIFCLINVSFCFDFPNFRVDFKDRVIATVYVVPYILMVEGVRIMGMNCCNPCSFGCTPEKVGNILTLCKYRIIIGMVSS